MTKTPDGEASNVLSDAKFKKTFNILADKPETVTKYFFPRILENTHIRAIQAGRPLTF